MLKLTEEWSNLAVDHLPLGLLAIDQKSHVRIFNRSMSLLTGLGKEKVLGRPFQEFLDGQVPELNKLLQTLVTGEEFQNLRPETVIPAASSATCTINTYPLRDKSGAIIGAMAMFTPLGREYELEKAVIKAEKLAILGQLSSEMVHEIRNPLTTISGFLQLLQSDLKGTPREEYINIMLTELEHVNRLVIEFLQLARPGYSRRTQFSITKLINEMVMLVESEALLRKVEIKLETAPGIPPVLGDPEQLKQAFLNIIKNAFDALSGGGIIFLQTLWDRHNKYVQVIIRDTGVGMDEQTIANMFYPFFTTKENGTGLGMLISKKIIDNHGGRIEVKSEPSKGTTVTVLLPLD